MKIKNITLKEFKTARNAVELDNILKNMKPKNSLCGQRFDLEKLSYINVRQVESYLNKGKTYEDLEKAFCLAFGITSEQFNAVGIIEYYSARNYLKDAVATLRKKESILLKSVSVHSDLWESAGGEKLNKFGNLMPLVKLGKIYGCFPFEMQHKPYNQILTLLVLHKEDDEVNARYNKLVNERINRK